MQSFLETPSRVNSGDQTELTEFAYEITNITDHYADDFQEFKASTTERTDKIERLIENVIEN